MDGNNRQARWRRVAYVILAAVVVANSGCAAALIGAGVAGGAGVAYLYHQGNVSGTYHAAFEDTRAATRTALADLGMPVIEEKADKGGGIFESRTADGYTVNVAVDAVAPSVPVDGPQTRVAIRVATFGDKTVSERIHRQIGAHLAPAAVAAPPAEVQAPAPVQRVGMSPTPPPPLLSR